MTSLHPGYPAVHLATMPVLRPVPIRTRGLPWYRAYAAWLFTRRDFELADDWRCRLPTGECVTIHMGYRLDGASVPRVLPALLIVVALVVFQAPVWFAVPALIVSLRLSPTGILLIPGLLHDYIFEHMALHDEDGSVVRSFTTRREADQLFNEVNRIVNNLLALTVLVAIILGSFSWYAWGKHRRAQEAR